MDFLRPATWAEALTARAERPDAVPIAGGTDVMVELNFDRRRPGALLDLNRIPALRQWTPDSGGTIRLGASVPYTRIIDELRTDLPGLAMASRTVGSPQIRNRGGVGGNLGAASPAGDTHPVLVATDAVIEVESAERGVRTIPATEFYLGVKRNALAPDELIKAVLLAPAKGPQQFSKIGTRNAMVIAVCSFAVALDVAARKVGAGIGSAAPTPRRPFEAELFAADALPWDSRADLDPRIATRFGELVAAAAAPIDDVRGTAAYRRHALSVMGRRTLTWAWREHQSSEELT
ncbi:FAD binding domain-containing protein [Catenulispora sp. NF23]|uniref:FAD binding domain-containing protein n=1 Tax=Catenulispora pinistramenti TaxID=2705254 RepID=A0ABS5KPZ5_9ACTN|nr:FAD binding domain-containing protein [Catenulispora pinistramenti]MBS2536044.1 FAD binding domain-containing protein [Catenulispora pinistramenti]MBS2548118.1 FAD binding domain-containing protein [Catenulispora pinistramenti]